MPSEIGSRSPRSALDGIETVRQEWRGTETPSGRAEPRKPYWGDSSSLGSHPHLTKRKKKRIVGPGNASRGGHKGEKEERGRGRTRESNAKGGEKDSRGKKSRRKKQGRGISGKLREKGPK